MPKYNKPMSNRNNITPGCKTCLSSLLLQSYINKWRILQVDKLDKLYINSASPGILQISKNDFIQYKNEIFPNNSHIHLRACYAASSCHFLSPIHGSNIPKQDYILSFCSDFPG